MENTYELAHGATQIKSARFIDGDDVSMDRDEADLARLGKMPVLKVRAKEMPWCGFGMTLCE